LLFSNKVAGGKQSFPSGSYISNKLVEYNKDEMKKYKNKDCVYILHIKDNIYKYGKSSKIDDRLYKHKQNLEYTNIISIAAIYVLDSINQTNILESDIKEFTKINKLNMYYNNGIEYFESNTNFKIDQIIEKIDELYKK